MERVEEYLLFGVWWERCLKPYSARSSHSTFAPLVRNNTNELKLDTVIHLSDWPESSRHIVSGAQRRKVDILVDAQERFSSTKPYEILESTVKVTYLRVDAQRNASPLSTVRYDYSGEPYPGHPVYHFHCENDPISEDRFPSSCRYKTVAAQTKAPCFPFRVPTPHMCLCSVLIGLVADHLSSEQFRSLWETIASNKWAPPLAKHCRLWTLGHVEGAPRVLHNWQWYFWPECNC